MRYPYAPEVDERMVHRATGRMVTITRHRRRWYSFATGQGFVDVRFDGDDCDTKLIPWRALAPLPDGYGDDF